MNKKNKIVSKIVLASLLVVVMLLGVNFLINYVTADSVSTSVTVGNSTPTITGNVAENPASTTASPTNYGSNVTFQGTANDANGDQYYLIVCDAVGATAGDDTAPTCTGTAWCTSTATNSDSQASCNYTTASATESNAWYAYACDKLPSASSPDCSSVNQGTGDSGTPFEINHAPGFTVSGNDTPVNPNSTITWTTTSSDGDSSGGADTVSLYVCSTASFTPPATCDVTELCNHTAQASNPTCGYTSLRPDTSYDGYVYIVDNHGMVAAGQQGTNESYVVNNVAPTLTSVTLYDTDGAGDLALITEFGTTTDFYVTFVVTDNNSCSTSASGSEMLSAIANAYRSGVTSASCDQDSETDYDSCYVNAQANTDGECYAYHSIEDCTGTTDITAGWRCDFPLAYHADPTVTNTIYPTEDWLISVQATDDDSAASSLTESAAGVEMGMFLNYDLTSATIGYGAVGADATSTEQTITVEATGNIGLDVEHSGGVNSPGDYGLCGNYPTCDGTYILTSQQHYNLNTGQVWSLGTALLYAATEAELNVPKTTYTTGVTTLGTENSYWLLQVPAAQGADSYTGQNTISGIIGESGSW